MPPPLDSAGWLPLDLGRGRLACAIRVVSGSSVLRVPPAPTSGRAWCLCVAEPARYRLLPCRPQWWLPHTEQAARNAACVGPMDVYELVLPEDEPALGAVGPPDGCGLGVQIAWQPATDIGWQLFVIVRASYLQVMNS